MNINRQLSNWESVSNSLSLAPIVSFLTAMNKKIMDSRYISLFYQATLHASENRPAVSYKKSTFSYKELLIDASHFAEELVGTDVDLGENSIAFLCNGYDYVVVQWAIWMAGGLAVPLCSSHPEQELEYVITDSSPSQIIVSSEFSSKLEPLASKHHIKFITFQRNPHSDLSTRSFNINAESRALMIYTSGTTGKPKGAVITHKALETQILNMVEEWKWKKTDKTLLVLPLHHIHGIVNILTTCLWVGGCCEIMNFEGNQVFEKLTSDDEGITIFMAVPTIYSKLIETYESFPLSKQSETTEKLSKLKLMVSGSMALPEPVFNRWEKISKHRLLERYGMTEVGMALTNPFSPAEARIPGRVGKPFSRIEVKIQSSDSDQNVGELLLKGPQLFKEYYNKPQATADSFTSDRWFKTGDIVQLHQDGTYQVLGRSSVDILKSGGYKISALEVEREFLGFEGVKDVAVIGIPDEMWGQRLHCFLVLKNGTSIPAIPDLVSYGKTQLAPYKVPRTFQFLDELPKNTIGKVQKKLLEGMVK